MKALSLILLSCFTLVLSCRKDSFISTPDARVTITVDTLKYDTVFVTAGSITQSFKIINENDRKLRISSVRLMGGNSSAYSINVDGTPGPEVTGLEIEANDSIYVFAQVNVDPGAGNLPFIIRDSIQVSYNGNSKLVQMEAWGQNAHFYRDKEILADETWNNDLPYVILGYLYIDSNRTLTINKGCRIYMHADAPIIVNGSLVVNGLKDTADRVFFQGDRLDDPYRDFPASWPGIYFLGSSVNNLMNYAVIKNAYQAIGIQDPAANSNPKLVLNECIIDNAYDAGIIAINSSISARNCLVSNCGRNLYLVQGGDYEFTHCTVVTIANRYLQHRDPVLTLSNYANGISNPLDALFRNCIFWGENGLVSNEVEVIKNGNTAFNANFDHNLWKVENAPQNISSTGIINNQPPLFDSINSFENHYNFRLQEFSPALDKGNAAAGIPADLDGNPRPLPAGTLPDLGCFERD
jgi:hypothetical protein